MSSANYAIHVRRDYADQDAKNRQLGLAGEEAVIEAERKALIAAGRQDLADRILHVAKVEGDGAGYDVKSFRSDGQEKFIEVKTTRGDEQTAFYVSANEVQFSACHSARYYLYRIFEFDQEAGSGKVFVHRGNLAEMFTRRPTNFKAALLPSS